MTRASQPWRSTCDSLLSATAWALVGCCAAPDAAAVAATTALWLFDEPCGLYPSSVLDTAGVNDYPLVLGQGGEIVPGKYGNALQPGDRPAVDYPSGAAETGLKRPWSFGDQRGERMTWANARFAALMTSGQRHLRKEVGFVNATDTKLNLGAFDWSVEFWFRPNQTASQHGVVFEIGAGPPAASGAVTRLVLDPADQVFKLRNDASDTQTVIPTDAALFEPSAEWRYLAFVYSADHGQLRHYVDGQLQSLPESCALAELPHGDEAYFTVGRDRQWQHPLPGAIDELRFSTGQVYLGPFEPPKSFAPARPEVALQQGPPLLFDRSNRADEPIALGGRKHLFIDDALVETIDHAEFVVNPPRRMERVIDDIHGSFRKHLTVVQDEQEIIRIYNSVKKDYLAVQTSRDGVHFEKPQVELPEGPAAEASRPANIVIPEMVGGLGNPFIDPNGPDVERWKYFSDYHRRGIYLYTSPDGYRWKRHKTATLPFRSGTQSCTFYDDQRQTYVAYHRSGIHHTPARATERSSVVTEHKDLGRPAEFSPLTQQQYQQKQTGERLRNPLPWYLDNGPLTPGGFGLEFPHAFRPLPDDPVGTDIYVTKAQKYPWAADTYLAFPIVYFHYWPDGPVARNVLALPGRGRGSGPLETQLSVSRDGLHWQRYPRPAYVGIGRHEGRDVHTAYLAHGMVRRGDEIWQYYFGETQFHTPHQKDDAGRGVYRLVQRLDGFVSLDSSYDRAATVVTKPLTFAGNHLTVNIDTDAAGYAQVGVLDDKGEPFPGFAVDDCIYINGDFVDAQVKWIDQGSDLSALAGKTVQLVFRMRGSKLYAMQFIE